MVQWSKICHAWELLPVEASVAEVLVAAVVAQLAAQTLPAAAFCGFYVAKADSKLFNKSSKVVLARDGRAWKNATALPRFVLARADQNPGD